MGTAALVMGIISIVISLGGSAANYAWVGSVCGILGIIFGALGLKGPKRGQAKAGLILSIIAFTWGIIATIVCLACFVAAGAAVGSMDWSSIGDTFSELLENFQ